MLTVDDFFRKTIERLTPSAGGEAAVAIARIIFEDVAGYDRKYVFMNGSRTMTDFMIDRINDVVDKVIGGEPVQYAVGKARFMGLDLAVNPSVLIPRPETEGLVDLITQSFGGRNDLRVLDIGTGSGCIAISLARALPFSRVMAFDISPEAIATARTNAESARVKIDFRLCDILQASADGEKFDIIVSNPPYVCRSEATEMENHVLNYEPSTALFVPDEDPLIFYKAIARYARKCLTPCGGLFFEINSRFPVQMRRLLEDEGFNDVDVLRDFRGSYRFATARQPR